MKNDFTFTQTCTTNQEFQHQLKRGKGQLRPHKVAGSLKTKFLLQLKVPVVLAGCVLSPLVVTP